MEYKNQNLTKYLDDLSARLPAPGGGSAAALNAAMGASLISMVVNFTLGKPKYAAFEEELKDILAKSEKLRKDFLDLVDLDSFHNHKVNLIFLLLMDQLCRFV